jgi:chromosome segregation ATPase
MADPIPIDESHLEASQSQALLAELREELATMKANQSQFVDLAQLAELRNELAMMKEQHRIELKEINAVVSDVWETLKENEEIRAEQAEVRAGYLQIKELATEIKEVRQSGAQETAALVEALAGVRAAFNEVLASLNSMVST